MPVDHYSLSDVDWPFLLGGLGLIGCGLGLAGSLILLSLQLILDLLLGLAEVLPVRVGNHAQMVHDESKEGDQESDGELHLAPLAGHAVVVGGLGAGIFVICASLGDRGLVRSLSVPVHDSKDECYDHPDSEHDEEVTSVLRCVLTVLQAPGSKRTQIECESDWVESEVLSNELQSEPVADNVHCLVNGCVAESQPLFLKHLFLLFLHYFYFLYKTS